MSNKKTDLLYRPLQNEKGVSAILVAILLPVLIGFAALAIDVGYMYATKNELQNTADAAALAGASEMGRIYLGLDPSEHASYDFTGGPETQIQTAVIAVADLNKLDNENEFIINTDDISIGVWDWELNPPLNPTLLSPDAVRVIARRDSSGIGNGAVATFFARIFSIFGGNYDTFDSSAIATAALTGIGTIEEGVLLAPFGISEHHECIDPILKLSPTTDSCAGWHNFFDKINAAKLSDKLIGLVRGYGETDLITGKTEGEAWLDDYYQIKSNQMPDGTQTPESIINEAVFEFQGGNIESMFIGGEYKNWSDKDTPSNPDGNLEQPAPFLTIFDFFRFRDGDGEGTDEIDFCSPSNKVLADNVWTTIVPIYQDPGGCSNPNQDRLIVGYANVLIRMPNRETNTATNYTQVEVCYDCKWVVEPGRGSGVGFSNVKGSIPNLVE